MDKTISLAAFKRMVNAGEVSMECIYRCGKTGEEIPQKLRGIRKAVNANSVGLSLQNENGELSWLDIPAAALFYADEGRVVIYNPAHRDLTAHEQELLDTWRKKEQKAFAQNPFCNTYWAEKQFFENSDCPWLFGMDLIKGQRYLSHENKVLDRHIRGDVLLVYRVQYSKEA